MVDDKDSSNTADDQKVPEALKLTDNPMIPDKVPVDNNQNMLDSALARFNQPLHPAISDPGPREVDEALSKLKQLQSLAASPYGKRKAKKFLISEILPHVDPELCKALELAQADKEINNDGTYLNALIAILIHANEHETTPDMSTWMKHITEQTSSQTRNNQSRRDKTKISGIEVSDAVSDSDHPLASAMTAYIPKMSNFPKYKP